MKAIELIISVILVSTLGLAAQEITPCKLVYDDFGEDFPKYDIPKSSIHSVAQIEENTPPITYYYNKPQSDTTFPIAIYCTGSSSEERVVSIIKEHRHFLQDFLDLGIALITLEQWGCNNNQTNIDEFMQHYTITQRLNDHKIIISSLFKNPPLGWNKKFIFVGISEGGVLVTELTTEYSDITLASINWSGAGDWNWREELWFFIKGMQRDEMLVSNPWYLKIRNYLPIWISHSTDLMMYETRSEYDSIMNKTLTDPTSGKKYMGMTYMYHADNLNRPSIVYEKIKAPYLVVSGDKDTFIESSDAFVEHAKKAGVNITYFRVSDMDHFVLKHPDIVAESFKWLEQIVRS